METLVIVLIIALIITIVIAVGRHVTADKFEEEIERPKELNRKQSDVLRQKGVEVDRLTNRIKRLEKDAKI